MATSPTQRSLALLRKQGYSLFQVVERWVPQARRRIDLFGIIDVVAIHQERTGVLGIQATSLSNFAHRVRKASESVALPLWIDNGNQFEVWGWGKKGPRGKRKTWQVKVSDYADVCLYRRRAAGDSDETDPADNGAEVPPADEPPDGTKHSKEKAG